jgi:hypothetical protein
MKVPYHSLHRLMGFGIEDKVWDAVDLEVGADG